MITVYGPEDGYERRAAETLKELACAWAPKVAKSASTHIDIYCNVTTPGVPIRDIDMLVCMWSDTREGFPPIRLDGRDTLIDNLVGIIEVKGHGERHVRFTGTSVTVSYPDRLEVLTETLKQRHGPFRTYLRKRGVPFDVRVGSVGWLTRFSSASAPDDFVNPQILFADQSFGDVLAGLVVSGLRRHECGDGRLVWRSVDDADTAIGPLLRRFFGEAKPVKRIGRGKIDSQFQGWFKDQAYAKDIGRKMFMVKGAAGTGKTVVLLRMSRDLILDHGATVVLASFNQALLNDLRGQMALWKQTDFDDFVAEQRLRLCSVHSLVSSIARLLDVASTKTAGTAPAKARQEWLTRVLNTLNEWGPELRDLLATEWKNEFSGSLDSTFVAIDEAQDVLPLERDILLKVFGPERMLVAFSDYQISRLSTPTRWDSIDRSVRHEVRLRKVWRSVALLTEFSKQFAARQNVGSEDERVVAREFGGGRIIVVSGNYFDAPGLHAQLLSDLERDGNEPMDMLVFVPAGDGSASKKEGSTLSHLIASGSAVWNGTERSVRSEPQTSRQEVRLLNYQSGRGLEGWTVVALRLDEYFDWLMRERPGFALVPSLFAADTELEAQRQAIRRIMMPLTRAIHTLVIEIRDPHSDFAKLLEPMIEEFADDIERIETSPVASSCEFSELCRPFSLKFVADGQGHGGQVSVSSVGGVAGGGRRWRVR